MTGDPLWLEAYDDLHDLHIRKSATYGTGADPLANFTIIGQETGRPAERYAWERIMEKAIRALNQIDAGNPDDVKEAPDVAGLALCAEALRLRRHPEV